MLGKMQAGLTRIWTRVTVSNSYAETMTPQVPKN